MTASTFDSAKHFGDMFMNGVITTRHSWDETEDLRQIGRRLYDGQWPDRTDPRIAYLLKVGHRANGHQDVCSLCAEVVRQSQEVPIIDQLKA